MNEFERELKNHLFKMLKGSVRGWIDVDIINDTLNVSIKNEDVKFRIKFDNVTYEIVHGVESSHSYYNKVIRRYQDFLISVNRCKYFY